MEYQIQERKMSSNVIERKPPGKKSWEVFIMCSHPKKDGDMMIDRIFNMLVPKVKDLEDIEDIEDTTEDDIKVLAQLMNGARAEGLLTEVIWSALQCNSGTVKEKIIYGYNEWIK